MKDKCHGHGIIRYGEKTFLDFDLTGFNVERGLKFIMCLICKRMETGMKAAGEKGKRTGEERFTSLTKASFMKVSGWMEMQNVELCQTLKGMKQKA